MNIWHYLLLNSELALSFTRGDILPTGEMAGANQISFQEC